MHTAYVLINSDIGSELEVLKQIRGMEGIEQAYALYGAYDVVVKVTSKSMEELKQIITWKIRKLDGIRATLTLMAQHSDVSE
jgi:DNA-binding Lrp family transcriptional regulator